MTTFASVLYLLWVQITYKVNTRGWCDEAAGLAGNITPGNITPGGVYAGLIALPRRTAFCG